MTWFFLKDQDVTSEYRCKTHKQNTSDGVQDMLSQNMALWHVLYFMLKEFEEQQVQEGVFWPSPEAGHKTLMLEAPSLYSEERSFLISKMRGHTERIWIGFAKFPLVYYSELIPLFVLSYFYMTQEPS